jgi:manganese oxidase
MRSLGLGVLLLASASTAHAQQAIKTHDNNTPAGVLAGGVLELTLRASSGEWRPEGDHGPVLTVEAFGESAPTIPGPLIRVPAGTRVVAAVKNDLPHALTIHGLCDRPATTCAPVTVRAGDSRPVAFRLAAPGTFDYWATSTQAAGIADRGDRDSQLGGAIVVDAPGAAATDRVLVLTLWSQQQGDSSVELTTVNGRSWPDTERLAYKTGDTVRWRVLNLSSSNHPMHLHGFYFTVSSEGNGISDSALGGNARLVVTEALGPAETVAMSWVPTRPGNWLFHCHYLPHMMDTAVSPELKQQHSHDASMGMRGLVMGISVTGPALVTDPRAAKRRLRMIVSREENRYGSVPGYRVDIEEDGKPLERKTMVPGPTLVLERDQPVAVEIVNRMQEPTAIHWHGIELDSYHDGVPGWGGGGATATPAIEPGRSFVAEFTPNRSGTFIYHTHWHNEHQLTGGLYGGLVVVDPGSRHDPSVDHLFVIGFDGPPPDRTAIAVNGLRGPQVLQLRAGVKHRFRFINITPFNGALTMQLSAGFEPVEWIVVAKDGASLPSGKGQRARQTVSVGETYDVEVGPLEPRNLWLELRRGNGEMLSQWLLQVRPAATPSRTSVPR